MLRKIHFIIINQSAFHPTQYPAMGLGNILIISGLVIAALLAAVVVFIFYRKGSLPCQA